MSKILKRYYITPKIVCFNLELNFKADMDLEAMIPCILLALGGNLVEGLGIVMLADKLGFLHPNVPIRSSSSAFDANICSFKWFILYFRILIF
ncbi:PH protein [Cucumis melo var. makuwa]|uniref:PH protein n=1 Tax=Cucumis melo var. makuwa TaxID=1194695 RepID=A0A5A7TX18_CUCMM|nr:PH protein [Cucumis melo var. makuwa]TYJ97756.1 PH protein [Cucumis melo var. makuwa]